MTCNLNLTENDTPILYSSDEGEMRNVRFDCRLSNQVRAKQYQGHSSDVITDITLDWLKNKIRDMGKDLWTFSFWLWGEHFLPGERKQMSGHIDVLPTLADLFNLEISTELKQEIEGNSLRLVLENPNTKLDENRMQIHHIGRWYTPGVWADHKYAGFAVRWEHYMLVRNEPCNDENCTTCFRKLLYGLD